MLPDLFTIHSVTFHTYGLFVAMGFASGIVLTFLMGRQTGNSPRLIADMAVYMILAAIAGSRIVYVLVNLDYFRVHPWAALKLWEGGLFFSGGIITVLVTVFWYAKHHRLSFWELGDLWAPAAALGQAVGRIGCFMAGCCYGKPTGSPLGILFRDPHALAPVNIPLHPTQLYSAAGGFGVTIVLLMIYARKKFPGQVLLWYLILYGTVSLFVEKYRDDGRALFPGSPLSVNQGLALLVLVGAIVMLFVLKSKRKGPVDDECDRRLT